MQNYTEIPSSQTLQSSLALLLGNDKTAASCFAGTVFPTTNLQVGMLCFRTDQSKLYQLRDTTPTWILLFDMSSGTALAPQATSISGWTPVQQGGGAGQGTNKVYIGWDSASSKLALQVDLLSFGTTWPINVSGDAATVGGKSVGNGSGAIPLSNGTTNANLNADKVDGYDAGNASGNIPVSNGTVSTNLNADMLDGYHATSFVRTISGTAPDASGNVVVDMSAKADRNGGNNYVALAGTVTAYTASLSGLSVVAGTRITVSNGVGANTGAATLSVNGSAAVAIQVWSNGGLRSLVAGEFPAGVMSLVYNGSVWILQDVTTVVRSAGGGLSKSGDSIAMTGLHGGGYIDADGTANGNSAGFTGVQSQAGRMAVRLTFDSYGRVTNAWTYNCNCVCDCTC